MKSSTRSIIARSTSGLTPEVARDLRAHAWRFVFDCWEQKKAASENGNEERVRKEKYVSRKQTTQ
jgi:hypothetical protein